MSSTNSLNEMNNEMLEVWKDYLELCSVFLSKAEEIQANEELTVNLELVRASITDLSINITNFKDLLSSNSSKANTQTINTQTNTQTTNIASSDRKKLVSLFFLFLMKIDKESLLNKNNNIVPVDNEFGVYDEPDLD